MSELEDARAHVVTAEQARYPSAYLTGSRYTDSVDQMEQLRHEITEAAQQDAAVGASQEVDAIRSKLREGLSLSFSVGR
jgi:hypothetical protein